MYNNHDSPLIYHLVVLEKKPVSFCQINEPKYKLFCICKYTNAACHSLFIYL